MNKASLAAEIIVREPSRCEPSWHFLVHAGLAKIAGEIFFTQLLADTTFPLR